jgi:hypothetical protein
MNPYSKIREEFLEAAPYKRIKRTQTEKDISESS